MKFAKNHLAAAAALALCPLASAQIGTYSQDFESLDIADAGALAGDGWRYTNVFNADGSFAYGRRLGAQRRPGFSVLNDTYAGPDQGNGTSTSTATTTTVTTRTVSPSRRTSTASGASTPRTG